MIQGGELQRKIVIIDYQLTQTALGGFTTTETVIVSTWANVKQVTNDIVLEALKQTGKEVYKFKIRPRNGVTVKTNNVVRYNGREYNIIKIETGEGQQGFIRITATVKEQ